MSADYRVALLAAGVVLLLAALLAGRLLPGALPARLRLVLRAGLGVGGLALLAWVLPSYLAKTAPPAPTPAVAVAAEPAATVDLMHSASAELSACAVPAPPAVPDAAHATLAQMTEARAAFQAYDAATNAYAKCVDAAVERVVAQQGGGASAADLERLRTFATSAHNVAIAQEQAVADQFNTQVRAYKAKHPK